MQALYKAGDHGVKPNAFTYSSSIIAWAKSGDPSAGKRADMYLQEMREWNIKPDKYIYSAASKTWEASNDPLARDKRIATLKKELSNLKK